MTSDTCEVCGELRGAVREVALPPWAPETVAACPPCRWWTARLSAPGCLRCGDPLDERADRDDDARGYTLAIEAPVGAAVDAVADVEGRLCGDCARDLVVFHLWPVPGPSKRLHDLAEPELRVDGAGGSGETTAPGAP